jgi:aryl-alcohol dehydrogenase-like predicted oxidoreductase
MHGVPILQYNQLGRTGLFVSELCLGTMTFGGGSGIWGAIGQVQQDGADALLRQAVEAGINFVDTADVYSQGLSEEITGKAIQNLGLARHEIVLATKVFGEVGPGPNARGASRAHIADGVRASLKRLGTDHIDLYQIHGFDSVTPIEETVRVLDDLVRHGLVRYVGVSNWAAWQIMKALGIAERHGLAKPVSLQAYYTVAGRDLEREIVPLLQSEGVGLMVWSPLAGGLLSGKFSRGEKGAEGDRRTAFNFPPVDEERGWAVIDAMRPIAQAHGVSVAQVALAWLLARPVVSSVIVGAKRAEQLADNIAATRLVLSGDELATLAEVSELPPEYPGWMIERQAGVRMPKTK